MSYFLFFLAEVEYIRTVETLTIRGSGNVNKGAVQDGYNFLFYKRVTIEGQILSIEDQSFAGCSNLQTVSMTDSVLYLKNGVFTGCSSLTSILLSNNIETIGNNCFENCVSLIEFTCPIKTKIFSESCFQNCILLNKMIFGGGCVLEEIGVSSFHYCGSLTSITCPSTLKIIRTYAFSSTGLTTFFVGPNVDTIDYGAFIQSKILIFQVSSTNTYFSVDSEGVLFNADKTTLVHYTPERAGTYIFPSQTTSIIQKAFQSSLIQHVLLSPGIKIIPYWCFYLCQNLTTINSGNIQTIESTAFYGTNFSTFDFSSCATIIGWAFATSTIERVIFSGNLEKIGGSCFKKCKKLTSVRIPSSLITWEADAIPKHCEIILDNPRFVQDPQTKIIYTATYSQICFVPLSVVIVQLPLSLTEIGQYSFEETQLSSINLHEGITFLGEGAFKSCLKLERITIPSTVTFFGGYLFQFSYNLKVITMSGTPTLKQILKYAFDSTGLISFTLPASVISTENDLFPNSPNLKELSILSQIPFNINWLANCTSFEQLNLGIPTILSGNFKNFKTIEPLKVKILRTVEKIESTSFLSCSTLTEVIFESESKLKEISSMGFSQCILLRSINLPSSIEIVTASTFSGCLNLREITIYGSSIFKTVQGGIYKDSNQTCVLCPPGLDFFNILGTTTKLGTQAFFGCEKLEFIELGEQLKEIDEECFYGCKLLSTIQIPRNIQKIGINSFGDCLKLKTIIYCGTTGSQIFYSGNIFPEFSKIIVGEYFIENSFCGREVIKSNSYNPNNYNCPLAPTTLFTNKMNRQIIQKQYIKYIIFLSFINHY